MIDGLIVGTDSIKSRLGDMAKQTLKWPIKSGFDRPSWPVKTESLNCTLKPYPTLRKEGVRIDVYCNMYLHLCCWGYIIIIIMCVCIFLPAARSPVFSAMFEHSMEESIKVHTCDVYCW